MSGEKNIGNRHGAKWTVEHDEELRKLRSTGFSASQIGGLINKQFGTRYTRNATIGRCHRLNLAANPPSHRITPLPDKRRRPREVQWTVKQWAAAPWPESVSVRCVEVIPQNVSLIDLAPNGCRWAYGDSPFVFCNQPQGDGSSYCWTHYRASVGSGAASERVPAS